MDHYQIKSAYITGQMENTYIYFSLQVSWKVANSNLTKDIIAIQNNFFYFLSNIPRPKVEMDKSTSNGNCIHMNEATGTLASKMLGMTIDDFPSRIM